MTVLLDYGMGNLRSVEKACQRLGFPVKIQQNLAGASRLIIPGVGAFGAAMERLTPLKGEIQAFARSAPTLGICLGMQLLFESSEEHGQYSGLEILSGTVRYLPSNMGLKVPHMGWSSLSNPTGPLMAGVAPESQVYFVHSLYCDAARDSDVAATAEYGITFPAAICAGNIWGTQFHPEKSSEIGLQMLRNFLTC